MPGESDALKGKISERAADGLEKFTRHGGLNDDDFEGWHEFIVHTFIDGRVRRDDLRQHLRDTRPGDTAEQTEDFLDDYEEALEILTTYKRLVP